MLKEFATFFPAMAKGADGWHWFFDRRYSAMFRMNINTGEVCPVRELWEDCEETDFQSIDIYEDEGLFYIPSQICTDILIYNVASNRFQRYQSPIIKGPQGQCLYNSAKCGRSIILLPQNLEYPTLQFDMDSRSFKHVDWFCRKGTVCFPYQSGNFIWLPIFGSNQLLKLDGRNFTYETLEAPKDVRLNSVCCSEKDIWMTQMNSKTIVHFDGKKYKRICLECTGDTFQEPFARMVLAADRLIVLPRFAQSLFIYQWANEKATRIPVRTEGKMGTASLFFGGYWDGEELLLLPWRKETIFRLNCSTNQWREQRLYMEALERTNLCGGIICEDDDINLDRFLHCVKPRVNKKHVDCKLSAGEIIYKAICDV